MGSLSRALDGLLGSTCRTTETATFDTQSSEVAVVEYLPEAETLSPFELIYQIYKEDGTEVVGNSRTTFAAFDPVNEKIAVYAKRAESIAIIPYRTVGVLAALECAQDEGASFTVCGSKVVCVLKGVSAQGSSYGEAALRALLMFQRHSKSRA